MPRQKKGSRGNVSKIRSSEKPNGRAGGKNRDQPRAMRTVASRKVTASDSHPDRSRQRNTNTGSQNSGAREVSRVAGRNTNKRSRVSSADSPGPRIQSRRIATREVESNPESSGTIESNDPQSLLTQADIPRIVDAVLSNLPDRDASLLPQDPPQQTDLQEPTSLGKLDNYFVCLLICALRYATYRPLPSPLDLSHIAIIPPESCGSPNPTNHQLPPSPIQSPAASIGAAIPPVPPQLVERIESGSFVEMAELIPSRLSFDEAEKSKPKYRPITNVNEWLQAFAVYVSVVAKKQPHRIPDLMGYQILIIEASNEYRNNGWLAYDRRFRQQVAFHPHRKWSEIDSTFWTLAFTGQANANRCRHCFSLFHPSQQCEFAPNPTSLQVEPPYKAGPAHRRLICHRWNYQPSQSCSYPYCRFKHVCYICADNPAAKDIHHKAIFCPYRTTNIHQPVTTQKPKPLFP